MAEAQGPRRPPDGRHRWRFRRGYLLSALVLVGSLLLVFVYARAATERERSVAITENMAAAERIATLLEERLLRYELGLRGGVSLFGSVQRPTERQWQAYVEGLSVLRQFPGVMGLGYAPYLGSDGLQMLQLERRAGGQGFFAIRPIGIRERYAPILYLEPRTLPNQSAIGYDMLSDPVRNDAMSAARDTGQIRMTAPLQLIQQGGTSEATGLLMYAPIYPGGLAPATLAGRRGTMVGWVYAPFAVDAFVTGVVGASPRRHAIRIIDVGAGNVEVYTDAQFHATDDEANLQHSVFRDVYGRRWQIDFRSPATAGAVVRSTWLVGVFASLMLFAMAFSLAHSQVRAERIAVRMSESYRRSEQRFRSAMEYSAGGIALLDHDNRIVEANPALEAMFDAEPEALTGRVLDSRFVDSDPHADEERERALAANGAYRTTRRLLRPDGDTRHLQLLFSSVPGEIGSDVTWLVQVEDVTDRLRAEEQVRTMNRLLEAKVAQRTRELTHANSELESFAYSVSHDLRAPLRSVEGFARVLAERHAASIDEEGRGYLTRIRNAALRMDALIDALLRMSRISREELRLDALDLSRIARDAVSELEHADPQRRVEVDIEPGLRAAGDPALVRDLLQNLIGNAWKFTRDANQARIEFRRDRSGADPSLVSFLVRDNGAGFEAGYASKLFRPFQRLHGANEFAGHGIGLATVKRIIERHGGTVTAEGAPGQGACFRFSLPSTEMAEGTAGPGRES